MVLKLLIKTAVLINNLRTIGPTKIVRIFLNSLDNLLQDYIIFQKGIDNKFRDRAQNMLIFCRVQFPFNEWELVGYAGTLCRNLPSIIQEYILSHSLTKCLMK